MSSLQGYLSLQSLVAYGDWPTSPVPASGVGVSAGKVSVGRGVFVGDGDSVAVGVALGGVAVTMGSEVGVAGAGAVVGVWDGRGVLVGVVINASAVAVAVGSS